MLGAETQLCVKRLEFFAQSVSAFWHDAKTTPRAVANFVNCLHDSLSRRIAESFDGTAMAVADCGSAGFELCHTLQDSQQQIDWFKSSHNDWHLKSIRKFIIQVVSSNAADMARCQKALNSIIGCLH